MSKYKYRYKCMTCGTEQVVGEEITTCGACGSDSLVKLEIGPEMNVAEAAATPHRAPCHKKTSTYTAPAFRLRKCWYCDELYPKALDICPTCGRVAAGPSPVSYMPPEKKSFWRRSLDLAKSPARFMVSLLRRVKWRIVSQIFQILAPFLIGAGVYCVLKNFI